MKYIKQYFGHILALTVLDQAVKLLIQFFWLTVDTDLIGPLLRFRPVHNTNLSWAGNFIPFLSGMKVTVILNLLCIALYISYYAFYRSRQKEPAKSAAFIFVCGMAGCLCSLIDKIFWGGSLDFLQIPRLFTFDLKDCYLSASLCLFVLVGLKHGEDISFREYFRWILKRR